MHKLINRWLTKLDPYLLLLLTLSLFALTPLLAPGYFYEAHDGRHSVFYLIQFDASFRDGAWWPRWAMHHIQGYGYPTFIIQAPLGFYLAEIFVLLGAGYTAAVKLAWALGFLISGWGMYQLTISWLRKLQASTPAALLWTDGRVEGALRWAGVVAGLLYAFIPYHLLDMYVRAALNDTLLLAWFPWVFLTFDRLLTLGHTPGWQRRLALAALTLAGTLLTHTFALISFAPLLVTFVVFHLVLAWRNRSPNLLARIGLAAAAGVGALLLYACFLLPLLVEGQHLQQQVYVTDTYDFRNHFVYWGQFFSPHWGFGYSDDPTGANDDMSFQVGALAVLLLMVGITLLWRTTQPRAYLLYLIGITVALLLLMTPLAAPIWEAVPALGVIQFPWRLLALVAFTLSGLAGLVIWHLSAQLVSSEQTGGALLIGLLAIFSSYSYINAPLQAVEAWREDGRAIFRFEREHPDMIAYTEWVQEPFSESPMTPDYMAEDYAEVAGENDRLTRLSIVDGAGTVISNYSRGSSMGGVVRLEQAATVRVNLFYFPGWQVQVDGLPVAHRLSNPNGLLEVDVPAGEHRIDVRMGSTPVRRLGALISWATLLIMVGLWGWPNLRPLIPQSGSATRRD